MVRPGERVLCAVSGGADSVAMLAALVELRDEIASDLGVAHVDHGLRPDSAHDGERVRDWAARLGLPFFSRSVEVGRQGSREEAARIARHQALGEMMTEFSAHRLALGHTASDRAETMLLFLTRGAGRRGLAAMPPVHEGRVIRPLSDVTRAEARAFARARRLPFADDSMNDDPTLSRNWVRSEVLPALRKLNPRADQTLAAAAQDLAVEEAWLEEQATVARPAVFSRVAGAQVALAAGLGRLPAPIRIRVLRQVLTEVRGCAAGVNRRHLEALEGLLQPGRRSVDLGGVTAWRDGAWLCLSERPSLPDRPSQDVRVDGPGRFVPRTGIEFEFRLLDESRGRSTNLGAEVFFDASRVTFPLWIRTPQPGDRLRLEDGGRQKISDRMAAAGVPPSLRGDWLLVAAGSEVVWVPGVRQSGWGRLDPFSAKVLCIQAHGLMFADPYANHLLGRSCTPIGESKG